MRDLQQDIKLIGTDPVREVQVRLYQRMSMPIPDSESHRILRMSPVISGLLLYHFRYLHRDIGVAVADASGSIQYSQHLYNALVKQKLLNSPWTDMQIVHAHFGDESFYVGGEAPQTPEDFFKKFCLQMGTSAAVMVKGRRKNAPLASKADPRGLKVGTPVQSMFNARYVENSGQVEFTPGYVN